MLTGIALFLMVNFYCSIKEGIALYSLIIDES